MFLYRKNPEREHKVPGLTSEPVPGRDLPELDQVHHVDGGDVVLPPSQVVPPVALHIHTSISYSKVPDQTL